MADKFLIAPFNSGIVKDVPSWELPEEAFQSLENATVIHGKIKKRFGANLTGDSMLTSRARYALIGAGVGVTDNIGGATGIIPDAPLGVDTLGMLFSIDGHLFTVSQAGAPAAMLKSGGPGGGTYNTTTGQYIFAGTTPLTQIYWYPILPIMGIERYEKGSVNEHVTYVADTKYIYKYSGNDWIKDPAFTFTLQGSNKQFFWMENYIGVTQDVIALFITNFNAVKTGVAPVTDDPMYYYNGTSWASFSAVTEIEASGAVATKRIASAKMIVSWKNRLLLANCIEQTITTGVNKHYASRIRYSSNGSPIAPAAGAAVTYAHPWLDKRQTYTHLTSVYESNGAGYIDLPIEEEIVSIDVVRDHLIVYCERSTWELSYTGNPALPFIWKSIDSDVGSSSTYSTTSFDDVSLTVGTTGVYACDGLSVKRIDKKIPDEISSFLKSENGTARVHGIRDYLNNLIYWTILKNDVSDICTYPNKIMVYNYDNNSWSFYDDTITTFGYFEESSDNDWTYDSDWSTGETWGSFYSQQDSRLVLAGNHQGFLFTINNDKPDNASVMTIANIALNVITVPNHNLISNEYVQIIDDNVTNGIYKVNRVDASSFSIIPTPVGVYAGGGTIKKVSRVNIHSAEWNPYVKSGDAVSITRIDFCVKNSAEAESIIYYSVDTAVLDMVGQGEVSNSILGTNVLEMHRYAIESTLADYKDILWRTVYFQATGNSISINITYSDDQMLDAATALSPFEIQAILLYTDKSGR